MQNQITPDILLDHGYKKHRHDEVCCDNALYQRVVQGPGGEKLYYINFYFWDFSRKFSVPKRTSIEVNARLYLKEGDTLVGGGGFDLNLHLEPTATLDQVEMMYARAYESLGCAPDWYSQN